MVVFDHIPEQFENRLLTLSQSRSHFTLLSGQNYPVTPKNADLLFAWGVRRTAGPKDLESLPWTGTWWFGYLGYELFHEMHRVPTADEVLTSWENAALYEPEVVGIVAGGQLSVYAEDPEAVYRIIMEAAPFEGQIASLDFTPVEDESSYCAKVETLKQAIQDGDIYEVNYCTAYQSSVPEGWDALPSYQYLASLTQAPFTAYVKMGKREVLCASPERFLSKRADMLISQPIKGTNRRLDEGNDAQMEALSGTVKERAENVMIVDLVRNDLSRVAQKGTVEVPELFGVHAFKNVNQMISTVQCNMRPDQSLQDVLKATFPMGSMTGAPKVSAMQHIAATEGQRRGIYSGSIGYIAPEGNMDFNVVIRTIAIDRAMGTASIHVGGAITDLCTAAEEYQECLLKAESMLRAVQTPE